MLRTALRRQSWRSIARHTGYGARRRPRFASVGLLQVSLGPALHRGEVRILDQWALQGTGASAPWASVEPIHAVDTVEDDVSDGAAIAHDLHPRRLFRGTSPDVLERHPTLWVLKRPPIGAYSEVALPIMHERRVRAKWITCDEPWTTIRGERKASIDRTAGASPPPRASRRASGRRATAPASQVDHRGGLALGRPPVTAFTKSCRSRLCCGRRSVGRRPPQP